MLFALIWGYIGSIRLADFVEYDRMGAHKDLLCILLLLCLFIKSGLFMFQAPLMDWAVLDMNLDSRTGLSFHSCRRFYHFVQNVDVAALCLNTPIRCCTFLPLCPSPGDCRGLC